MDATNQFIGTRPTRQVRLIEHAGVVVAFPEPHRTPVLPAGWAPLSREQQDAVQRACDLAPTCLIFRLGSVWEPHCEYRVYRLAKEQWAMLSVVCRFVGGEQDGEPTSEGRNEELLGLAWDPQAAIKIATDFFNWDLEAHGQTWRLAVENS